MRILDFGSLNLDNVFQVSHLVKKGETLKAKRVDLHPGGKGLNQAIAASRAGSEVHMAGCIGKDGGYLLQTLHKSNVHTEFVDTLVNVNTGRAIIEINPEGDNSILCDPGANEYCQVSQILSTFAHFRPGDYLLCQNETNQTEFLISTARKKGLRVVFNPSPITEEILAMNLNGIAVLAVNEFEASVLAEKELDSPFDLCRELIAKYPASGILLTLGSQGSVFARGNKACFMPSFPVKVVDTTGAGDTYLGYFADGLNRGLDIPQTMRRASAAAALAIGKQGAADSIPKAKDVVKFLKKNRLDPMESSL